MRFHSAGRSLLATRQPSMFASAVAAAVVVLGLGLWAAPQAHAGNPRRTGVVDVVEKVRAAVVNVHSERTAQGPASTELFSMAPSQNRINGMGTGVLIDPRGYIVTNQHVVEDVNLIRVRLSDGTTHSASVIARDHDADLALLKIETGKPLPIVPLGTARDLMVGETVIAIGNAYGYEHTVTVGVVSAIKRDVNLNKEVSYKSLIQTDASINPGNSGGPLLNINGEMIGINVAIRAGAQGISFAIPVDAMILSVSEMLAARKRSGIWHGLVCRNYVGPEEFAFKLQSAKKPSARDDEPPPLVRELIIDRVEPSSPAAAAGLQTGDVVVQVADLHIASSLELERALLDRANGEKVPVLFRRKGAEKHIDLVLQSAEKAEPTPADLIWKKLGVRLKPAAAEMVAHTSQQLRGGLTVLEINPRGLADKAGIQKGDILVGLHQWETLTIDNVAFVLTHQDLATFNPLSFYIVRDGQVRRGWLQRVD